MRLDRAALGPLRLPGGSARAAALLAVVLTAAGCGRSGDSARSSIAREGAHGAHRFRMASDLEPARATLGQPCTWTLRAELPRGSHVEGFASEPAPALDVSERMAPGSRETRGALVWSGTFRVRAFDLGQVPLPRAALRVRFADGRDTLFFPVDTLAVDSLTEASSGSIEGDRGPIAPELRPIDVALAAALALLAIAALVGIVLAIRRRRRRAKGLDAEAPPEPPERPFLRALEDLRGEIETLPRDRFYDRLSLAVRAYVAAVTGIPALDLTTTELAREMDRRADVRSEAATLVSRSLVRSDLAKFARHEDPFAEARDALEQAASLAGSIRIAPTPAPLAAGADSGASTPPGAAGR